MTAEELGRILLEAFPAASVRVSDLTGTSDHFRVEVSSERFAGLSTLDQHRLVHQAVGERLTREIHALEIRTVVAASAEPPFNSLNPNP